jgi:hypothetical protein
VRQEAHQVLEQVFGRPGVARLQRDEELDVVVGLVARGHAERGAFAHRGMQPAADSIS